MGEDFKGPKKKNPQEKKTQQQQNPEKRKGPSGRAAANVKKGKGGEGKTPSIMSGKAFLLKALQRKKGGRGGGKSRLQN